MNTRFRPTPSHPLHCGHAWIAWLNWRLARATGGEFLVIVDDLMYRTSRLWQQAYSLQHAMDLMAEDMEWLGLTPFRMVRSLENEDAHLRAAEQLGYLPVGEHSAYFIHMVPPAERMAAGHAYHSYLVAARVVDDHLLNVGGFYRGADLTMEMQLYDDISRRLGFNPAGQSYVPTVSRELVPGKESKSDPRYFTLAGLREAGYNGQEVILTLRECAARSEEQNLKHVLIPDGILETPTRHTLKFYDRALQVAMNDVADKPWRSDVVAAVDEYHRTLGACYGREDGASGEVGHPDLPLHARAGGGDSTGGTGVCGEDRAPDSAREPCGGFCTLRWDRGPRRTAGIAD
jgi:glutamyl/glutaminyl-tRNA synthetase